MVIYTNLLYKAAVFTIKLKTLLKCRIYKVS